MEPKAFYTDRLILRELNDEEWDKYYERISVSDEIFFQYGYEPDKKLLEFIQNPTPYVYYFSVILKETNEMVGYVGIPEFNNSIEYYIFKEYRHQGFAFEALKRFIEAYLDGFITGKKEESVTAEIIIENDASKNLIKKLGFTPESIGFRLSYNKDETELEPINNFCSYVYFKESILKEII